MRQCPRTHKSGCLTTVPATFSRSYKNLGPVRRLDIGAQTPSSFILAGSQVNWVSAVIFIWDCWNYLRRCYGFFLIRKDISNPEFLQRYHATVGRIIPFTRNICTSGSYQCVLWRCGKGSTLQPVTSGAEMRAMNAITYVEGCLNHHQCLEDHYLLPHHFIQDDMKAMGDGR
jgi:hypothetical protein